MFNLWNSLPPVTRYEYESTPGPDSAMGWKGFGSGTVDCDKSPELLYFKERGTFTLATGGRTVETQNEFIWQRLSSTRIKLSHSRFGRENPVTLFDLVYDPANDQWLSETAHVCGDDLYSGKAAWIDGAVHFSWSISGPRKQESLHYIYSR
ncbi:DUF6314 family protein [Tichowtungia aerotolerans]|uniref:DUF6314 domain-containing protein n=1 Tax=Tichowtungia aerotolerans TaxID=2697043 RepID=A0A6P1M791_9BACT|nr:DUF6314 family protein [Tichowtungia aerotolerans]QHI68903.1 hypothetical protein GT409_05375 [Tichowtungia aerotolerans]